VICRFVGKSKPGALLGGWCNLRDLQRLTIRAFIIRQAAVSITPNGPWVVNDAAGQP